jgi:hypothetical protein
MITSAREDVKELHGRGQKKLQARQLCLPILAMQRGHFSSELSTSGISDNPVVDAPVEAAFPTNELYVNCNSSAWHNQYWEVPHHIIKPDAARAISKYTCSQKGEMC